MEVMKLIRIRDYEWVGLEDSEVESHCKNIRVKESGLKIYLSNIQKIVVEEKNEMGLTSCLSPRFTTGSDIKILS